MASANIAALLRASRWLALGGTSAAGATLGYRYNQILQSEQQLPVKDLSIFVNGSASQEKKKKQRVIIIGGGVVGIATAYQLMHVAEMRAQTKEKKQDDRVDYDIVLLEAHPSSPGQECSACAAGGMQRSNPSVDRNTWISVLKSLTSPFLEIYKDPSERSFQFFNITWSTTLTDPFFVRWLYTFTKTSLFPDAHQERKQLEMLNFTKYAVDKMVGMMNTDDDLAQRSGYNDTGSLSVSYDTTATTTASAGTKEDDMKKNEKNKSAAASNPTGSKHSYEPSRRLETTEQVLQVEPSLQHQAKQPTSAKFEYESRAANAERFTKVLEERLVNGTTTIMSHTRSKKKRNIKKQRNASTSTVNVVYDTRVQAITTTTATDGQRRIAKLHTNQGVITVDDPDTKIVVAAGAWTPHIMAQWGYYAPVYPLKGYSMSVSAKQVLTNASSTNQMIAVSPTLATTPAAAAAMFLSPSDLPSRIVADKFMYTSRLGPDEIRITSIGEFSGWNTKPTKHVDEGFRREAIRQFPQLASAIQAAPTRCGHRPYVSDGILLLGAMSASPSPLSNVYLSCGPGSNGWKLCMGSAEIIQRLIDGETEEDMSKELGFDVSVFAPKSDRVVDSPLFAQICRARWGV